MEKLPQTLVGMAVLEEGARLIQAYRFSVLGGERWRGVRSVVARSLQKQHGIEKYQSIN